MKKFIIINGKQLIYTKKETIEDARDYAIAICDHSLEIIVREIEIDTQILIEV